MLVKVGLLEKEERRSSCLQERGNGGDSKYLIEKAGRNYYYFLQI